MGIGDSGRLLTRRAVFLDRDGTLNRPILVDRRSHPPASVEEFELYPGVVESLAALKAAGFVLVVVTNQPDVGAGRQRRDVVQAIHLKMRELLPIDDVRVCYHTDADGCDCRKPRPGMLRSAATDHHLDLASSFMIGDRWRDVDAGRAAGCRTIFIRNAYDERQPDRYDFAVDSLAEASRLILDRLS